MGRTVVATLTLLLLVTSASAERPGEAYRGKELDRPIQPPPVGAKVTVIDHRAFWSFRFEHEKETILAGRIEALRKRVARPTAEDIREHMLPLLRKSLTDRDDWVREAATVALGKVGGQETIPFLLARVENDPSPEVVDQAILGLGLCGVWDALPHLRKALASKKARHRHAAALALGLSGRPEARRLLVEAYEAAMKCDRKDKDFLCCLAVALGAVGTAEDVPMLAAENGRKKFAQVNVHVCQALGRIGGEKAQDEVRKATRDRNGNAQAAGILAMGNFPGPRAAMDLLGKYGEGSGRIAVRNAALVSLGRFAGRAGKDDRAGRAAAAVLAECAHAPQKNIYATMHAVLAQGEFGLRDSVPYCLDVLKTKNLRKLRDDNASAVVMSLGLLREKAATTRIRELAQSIHFFSQDSHGYCAFALGLMGDRTQAGAIRDLMRKYPNRKGILRSGCWALALIGGKEDIPYLLTLLEPDQKRDKYVRGAAAIAIGLLGDRETLAELVTLAKESEHASVRALAIAAIGWLVDKDAVPRLPRLFHGLLDRQAAHPIKDAWSLL